MVGGIHETVLAQVPGILFTGAGGAGQLTKVAEQVSE